MAVWENSLTTIKPLYLLHCNRRTIVKRLYSEILGQQLNLGNNLLIRLCG